jgi:hypothetical protein
MMKLVVRGNRMAELIHQAISEDEWQKNQLNSLPLRRKITPANDDAGE